MNRMDRRPAKVLVVEDHPDLLQFLDLVLTRHGWDVITSSSGREALDKLKYTSPRLILLDMWMPGMDGFELARFLKRCPHYRDIPILAVTLCEPQAMGMRVLGRRSDREVSDRSSLRN